MTQLTIRTTISEDTRILLTELFNNAMQCVQNDLVEDVSDVKIIAAHLNAIVEALEDDKVCEPQINKHLCITLQSLSMAHKFDWQSILQDPDLDPEVTPEEEAEVLKAVKPRTRKRKTA